MKQRFHFCAEMRSASSFRALYVNNLDNNSNANGNNNLNNNGSFLRITHALKAFLLTIIFIFFTLFINSKWLVSWNLIFIQSSVRTVILSLHLIRQERGRH